MGVDSGASGSAQAQEPGPESTTLLLLHKVQGVVRGELGEYGLEGGSGEAFKGVAAEGFYGPSLLSTKQPPGPIGLNSAKDSASPLPQPQAQAQEPRWGHDTQTH
jgi:hypothetical protein